MAPEFYIDTRTLTPVRGLHVWPGYNIRDCTVENPTVQDRKWVTLWRWQRLSDLKRSISAEDLPHFEQHKTF